MLSDANSDGIPDTVTTTSRSQVWSYDPLGNWSTVTNNGTAQNRTHNRQNQITSITSLTTPTYDNNGNMTADENGKTLVYDAWNRLVDFKNGSTSLEAYKYDALNRRIEENPGTARALFYTAEWQVVEERTSGAARVSYVWSPACIDALIVRDRDADGAAGGAFLLSPLHPLTNCGTGAAKSPGGGSLYRSFTIFIAPLVLCAFATRTQGRCAKTQRSKDAKKCQLAQNFWLRPAGRTTGKIAVGACPKPADRLRCERRSERLRQNHISLAWRLLLKFRTYTS